MSSTITKWVQALVLSGTVAIAYLLLAAPVSEGGEGSAVAAPVAQSLPVPNPAPEPSTADLLRPAVAVPVDTTSALHTATAVSTSPAMNDRQARGLVRAVSEATLSAGMVAQIVRMPFAEGGAFKKGDVLVEFNCERPLAEQRAADAAMQVESKTVETNQELEHFNSIGKFDLLISESKFNKAKAELEALNAQIKQCKIFAPFSGRVIENKMHVFESASVSQPLLKVVDTSNLEVDVIVPSQWLRWLKPGASFAFKVDETDKVTNAVVDRILPTVDPVSKTIKIIGRFSDVSGSTFPGMSGSASFQKTES